MAPIERERERERDLESAQPHLAETSTLPTSYDADTDINKRESSVEKRSTHPDQDAAVVEERDVKEDTQTSWSTHAKWRKPFLHAALVLLLLGWWIPTLIINRRRWIPATVLVWFFIGLIAFQYIPNRIFTEPIGRVYKSTINDPWFRLPRPVRLGLGWLALLALVFGSAFGVPLQEGSSYGTRAQSVFGLFVFQFCFWLSSAHRKSIRWHTVIVGLIYQQAIALFVLKSGAGFAIFNWIATLAADFLAQAYPASVFFFGDNAVNTLHLFFTTVLPAIIFFVAFAELCAYFGILQWLIKKIGWFFYKTMDISGAEATVAAGSPFIGQGESAVLIKPFVDASTTSEMHQILTSGFATIAGSVLSAYIFTFGISPVNLVTAAVMSIPSAIAISKLRMPEVEEPLTAGRMVSHREEKGYVNGLQAFSSGAAFGVKVATLIFCNVLVVLAAVYATNGLLTYIGQSWGIHELTLELIMGYVFYPLAWLMGVPNQDLRRVGSLLGIKLVANEFVAYGILQQEKENMTPRAYAIASFALAGFANIGSLGINIGVLSALAPSKKAIIAKISVSALICGFLSTCQAAAIAGQLL
ncbi:hypothetical protein T439DRAFT_326647 [Meredithblackwellia eburnea MCA 4105]